MPQINTIGSSYVAPSSVSGYEWLPFTDKYLIDTINAAFYIVEKNIKGCGPCNKAFKSLPGGRDFDDIWQDSSIWVSYYPSIQEKDYGATLSKKHITLSKYTLLMGRWTAVATLVHELAHCAGASGSDTKAEDTLLKCGLHKLHDPKIIGYIIRNKTNNLA